MPYQLGRPLGWVIVIALTLTLLNFAVKRISRHWIMKLPKDAPLRTNFQAIMRIIVKGHPWFGLITILALLSHFIIQYTSWGFFISGIVAGSLLLVQGALGAFGTFACGRKSGPWLLAHRAAAVLLLAAITTHILIARFN